MQTLRRLFIIPIIAIFVISLFFISSCSDDPTSPEQPIDQEMVKIEDSVFVLINNYRLSIGKTALVRNDVITEQCRIHSLSMANGVREFGHDGFSTERVQAINSKIPMEFALENVAMNKGYDDPAKKAVDDWIASASHLENIRSDAELTGIGVRKSGNGEIYFTQIFVKRK